MSAKAGTAMAASTLPCKWSCSRRLAIAAIASTLLFLTTCGHIPGSEVSNPAVRLLRCRRLLREHKNTRRLVS